jgi:hypothetical protein
MSPLQQCTILSTKYEKREDSFMVKKATCVILIFAVAVTKIWAGQAFAAIPGFKKPAKEIRVFIDSKEVYLTLPILCDIKNNRTLYPFRELLETIGAEVYWEQKTKTACAYYNGIMLKFPQEQNFYYINDEKKMMDTKTTSDSHEMRTYIPIRYAFEALGYEVDWIPCKRHNEIRISNLGPFVPVSDEVFVELHREIPGELYNKYTTSHFYDIDAENKRFLFKDGYKGDLYNNYVLEEEINPKINEQVYNLTKALIGDDQYIYVKYLTTDPYRVYMAYAKNMDRVLDLNNVTYFNFFFYEREYVKTRDTWDTREFSNKTFMSLYLKCLSDYPEPAKSIPFYEKKLRDSFIALFGEKEGRDIYKYIYTKYVQVRNMERSEYINSRDVEKFDSVQVDFAMGTGSTMYFYFSYLR